MNKLYAMWRSVVRLFAVLIIGVMLWTLVKFGWQVLNVSGAGVNRAVQVFYIAAAVIFILLCLQNIVDAFIDIVRVNRQAWRKEEEVEEPLAVPKEPPRVEPPSEPELEIREVEYDEVVPYDEK